MSTDRARVIFRRECAVCGGMLEGTRMETMCGDPEHSEPVERRYVALDAAVEALRERGEFACGGFEKEAAAFLEAEFGVPQPERPA